MIELLKRFSPLHSHLLVELLDEPFRPLIHGIFLLVRRFRNHILQKGVPDSGWQGEWTVIYIHCSTFGGLPQTATQIRQWITDIPKPSAVQSSQGVEGKRRARWGEFVIQK